MTMINIVEVKGLKKEYTVGVNKAMILRDIDLSLKKGDFVALAGPSGSGKTTLLNLIGCIDTPSEGKIFFQGEEISTADAYHRTLLRREKIGYIFQTFNLLSALTVYENIEFPLLFTKQSQKERAQRVESVLNEIELSHVAGHRVTDISGGQQQRCAIGRALVKDPILILADEPTGNLDFETGRNILELMQKLNQSKSVTFLFSTHDPMVMGYADRIYKLRNGLLEE